MFIVLRTTLSRYAWSAIQSPSWAAVPTYPSGRTSQNGPIVDDGLHVGQRRIDRRSARRLTVVGDHTVTVFADREEHEQSVRVSEHADLCAREFGASGEMDVG